VATKPSPPSAADASGATHQGGRQRAKQAAGTEDKDLRAERPQLQPAVEANCRHHRQRQHHRRVSPDEFQHLGAGPGLMQLTGHGWSCVPLIGSDYCGTAMRKD
jgi:hypothetical protein